MILISIPWYSQLAGEDEFPSARKPKTHIHTAKEQVNTKRGFVSCQAVAREGKKFLFQFLLPYSQSTQYHEPRHMARS